MKQSIQSILHSNGEGLIIEIECSITNGLPAIIIIGLGNKSIDEAKERIRSAFHHCKLPFPKKRITINLAPADIPKESTSFDVAIAAAIMQAHQHSAHTVKRDTVFIGEVGLDGTIRSVRGIIGKIIAGKKRGISTFYIPDGNMQQASLIPEVELVPLKSLSDLSNCLFAPEKTSRIQSSGSLDYEYTPEQSSLNEVIGQQHAKRALEIAAAGGHNIFLSGPPGTGKSMLAKALPQLLPPLCTEEILEVTHLHSLASNNYERLIYERPFRAPHHTASQVAIIGGGQQLKPGEISLSHRGVLFLDEMPEFTRSTLEALRQPLEDRVVSISRAKETALFPADFLLVATANPCPCGYYGTDKECACTAAQIIHYKQKISGPIVDRIDLHVTVEVVDHASLLGTQVATTQADIMENVRRVRGLQAERFGSRQKLTASMDNKEIRKFCIFAPGAKLFLNRAAITLSISARSYMKIAKISRTIADLDGSRDIKIPHISEALQYRSGNNSANS